MKVLIFLLFLAYISAAIPSRQSKKPIKKITKKNTQGKEQSLQRLLAALAGSKSGLSSKNSKITKKTDTKKQKKAEKKPVQKQALKTLQKSTQKKRSTATLESMVDEKRVTKTTKTTENTENTEKSKEKTIEIKLPVTITELVTIDDSKPAKPSTQIATLESLVDGEEIVEEKEVTEDEKKDAEKKKLLKVIVIEEDKIEEAAKTEEDKTEEASKTEEVTEVLEGMSASSAEANVFSLSEQVTVDIDMEKIKSMLETYKMTDSEQELLHKVDEELVKKNIPLDQVITKAVQIALIETTGTDGTKKTTKFVLGMYSYSTKENNPILLTDMRAGVFTIDLDE